MANLQTCKPANLLTSQPPNLPTLRAAGAEVSGQHGDAWERIGRPVSPNEIRQLRERLGRPVLPSDVSGRPMPVGHLDRGPPTPGQIEFQQFAYVPLETTQIWRKMIADHGSGTIARRAGVSRSTAERVARGEHVTASTIARVTSAVRAFTGKTRKIGEVKTDPLTKNQSA